MKHQQCVYKLVPYLVAKLILNLINNTMFSETGKQFLKQTKIASPQMFFFKITLSQLFFLFFFALDMPCTCKQTAGMKTNNVCVPS